MSTAKTPPKQKTNMKRSPHFIILGAGRPHQGKQHSALRTASGMGRVLDWLLHAISELKAKVLFVGGYQIEEIAEQYPHIHYTINPEWENTGAAVSLLEAPLNADRELYTSYSDILFRNVSVHEMAAGAADIVVAVDTQWTHRYEGRTPEDMARCEKANVYQGEVTRLGSDIDPALADAEFVGLVRFAPRVVRHLLDETDRLKNTLRRANLSQLVEVLRTRGFRVRAVDVSGDWAELNESRDLAHFVLGTKAQTLHRLQGMVSKSRIEDQVSFTVSEWLSEKSTLSSRIGTAFSGQKVVVRSSALSEDGFGSANAGAYSSVLNVDGGDTDALTLAISEVVNSYPDGNSANQVLVQPMVADVQASGVAFTRTLANGAPYYVVNYDDITQSTESITSGSSRDHKTLLIHRDADASSVRIPTIVRGLLPALREIEQLLGYDSLDIEFAVSGGDSVHILQVRPIAVDYSQWEISDSDVKALLNGAHAHFSSLQTSTPFVVGRRAFFGVMPDWNPAEIIGTKPGRLAMGLYRYLIMDECWAAQRAEYGYRDVRPHPLLVAFAGHPYVDIRASFNSFMPAAIDDELAARLVDFYMDWLERHPHLHDKVEFDVVPTCFSLDFDQWEHRLINEGGFLPREVKRLRDELQVLTRNALKRNQVDLDSIARMEERFRQIMETAMPPLEKAVVLLEDCCRYGTLAFSHLARSAFVAVTLLRSAVDKGIMRKEAMDAFLNSIRTVSHRFTEDAAATADGRVSWEDLVARYAHLRPGTYDITSQSYGENPEHFLRPIVEQTTCKKPSLGNIDEWKSVRETFGRAVCQAGLANDIGQVERFMREAIEGREYAKFVFTRNLSAAIDCLMHFGQGHGVDREELANIPLDAFFALRTGTVVTTDVRSWLKQRAEEGLRLRHMARAIELPPLLLDEQDLFIFMYPSNQPNYVGRGRITCECIDLATITDQQGLNLAGKIVMIPQADPGYDWLFGQEIAGLVTMYGGANSHMAIRAAEFGLPAAIGIGEIDYVRLANASVLELDAGNRHMEVIR